jgi:hypothetical protein
MEIGFWVRDRVRNSIIGLSLLGFYRWFPNTQSFNYYDPLVFLDTDKGWAKRKRLLDLFDNIDRILVLKQ